MSTTPAIRFEGFADPWEQRKLGDITRRVTRKNENLESQLPLTISAQYGLVDQTEFFNNRVASSDLSGYYLLNKGEFAYNKSTSSDSPWGAVKRLERYEKGCVSTLYIVFEALGIDPQFLVTYYETDRWYKGVQAIAAEGARNHGLLNIAPSDFFETELTVPVNEAEQGRIGELFASLDNLITLHQRKHDRLVVLKKALLDKMFPRDGSRFPELRFGGFTDPWEQRKLGEMGTTYGGLTGKTKEDFGHGDARFVPYTNVFDNPIADPARLGEVEVDASQNRVLHGDALFTVSSETPEEVGMSSVWLSDLDNLYLNSFCFGYRQNGGFDPYYLAYMLRSKSVREDIELLAQGISRFNISKGKVMEVEVPVPEMAEQRHVGALFYQLDNLITLHQRKLELLRNLKSACLDKMFV